MEHMYDRFKQAYANGVLVKEPYEYQEYPKRLYKGEGIERLAVDALDADQEAHFRKEGFDEHKPPAVEKPKAKPPVAPAAAVVKPLAKPEPVVTKSVPTV